MEFFSNLGVLLIFGSTGIVVYLLVRFQLFRSNWDYKSKEKQLEYIQLLEFRMEYFRKLSPAAKDIFAARTNELQQTWTFHGVDMEVDQEMEYLISATAVQLSFGYREFLFDGFENIYLHPEPFFVKQFNGELRGAVSPLGVIHLSWKNFTNGYSQEHDGINLGLHEMAHALFVSLALYTPKTLPERAKLNTWMQRADRIIDMDCEEYQTFFRKYAFTNKQEFLAVTVEQFFERPEPFFEALPNLFSDLCWLLNQNPLNVTGDYKLGATISQQKGPVIERLV